MRKLATKKTLTLIAILITIITTGVFAQKAPLIYFLPAGNKVVIVLGDTPRSVASFMVYRKDTNSKKFKPLTPSPVTRVKDPYKAAELIGNDFNWIAKRVGSDDPDFVYNRLVVDRNTTLALCLVSHGLRRAMGRTYVDTKVNRGNSYRYRVILLNILGKEIKRVEKTVKVTDSPKPQKPKRLTAEAKDGKVILKWEYPKYRGGERDLTVGFLLYRKEGNAKYIRITRAPILRVEGWLTYIDERIKNGNFYTYAIEAINMVGAKSERTYSKPVKPIDKKPPLVPADLKAIDKKEGVLLLWKISPEPDAHHYNVYRAYNLKEKFKKINKEPIPVESPKFLDKDVQRGVVQYYRVSAVDKSGNESALSGPASIIPKDTEPPSPIDSLSVDADPEKRYTTLSWPSLEERDIAGYHIYRGLDKNRMLRITQKPIMPKAKKGKLSFVDMGYKKRGLRPGVTLWYAVTAIDTSGNEGEKTYTKVLMPDKLPPPPPFYLSAKSTKAGEVLLTWQPCLSRDLDKHYVYRSEGEDFVKIKELNKDVYQWRDKSVERGKRYTYRVTEVDTSGNESKPSKEVSVIPTDVIPPAPPSGIKRETLKWGTRLTWEASKEIDLKGYFVYRLEPGTNRWKRLNSKPLTKEQYFDRWANPKNIYGISAIDTSGNESKRVEVKPTKEEVKK